MSLPYTLTVRLNDEQQTQQLAEWLAAAYPSGVVFLQGDLGAGKTTLVRYWLKSLGVTGSVKSPTYTLIEPYQVNERAIYHMDLYRLQDPEELDMMGFQDYVSEGDSPSTLALILMEWPSKAGYLQPTPNVTIDITVAGEVRHVNLSSKAPFDALHSPIPDSLL